MSRVYRVALVGNPNCGKTTVFNALSGARAHVGNYSGVTVDRETAMARCNGLAIEYIDLPGVYSLASESPEEKLACAELTSGRIDLIVNVLDAGNLQRNLYLTTQLLELRIPMVLGFNMADDARNKGLVCDNHLLERYFAAPIIDLIAVQGVGIPALQTAICRLLAHPEPPPPPALSWGPALEEAISRLEEKIAALPPFTHLPPRYLALRMLEGKAHAIPYAELLPLLDLCTTLQADISRQHRVNTAIAIADMRHGIIAGACRECLHVSPDRQRQISDSIDRVVINRVLGLPIFFLIMFLVFLTTFTIASPLSEACAWFFHQLTHLVKAAWPAGFLPYGRDLLAEGVIGGVGSVLSFLPNILMLFVAIAILETTGYMSRAAFVMDGFMHTFGLHGKSFIPMLLGFGCTVPAIMATRTIESRRDRLTTIMVLPLLSCGARLPIYSMIIPAFFQTRYQALILWGVYLTGLALALLGALILKSTLFKGDDEVFVMELPPYRLPSWQSLFRYVGERLLHYLKKAGTVILLASVILYFFNTFPRLDDPEASAGAKAEYSLSGRFGKTLTTVLAPLGFDWQISSALVGAFAGKELFVSQLGILYSGESQPLPVVLKEKYTPLQGLCIMLFCLISMPCLGTMAAVRKETDSWLLCCGQLAGLSLLAYVVTLVFFQAGRLMSF